MGIRIGDSALDFEARTTEGVFQFYTWLMDSWCLLFTYPSEFTPVCNTELSRMASLKEEFTERNVKIIALSINSLKSHMAWIKDRKDAGNPKINFPIIADENKNISLLYDNDIMSYSVGSASYVRTVIVIDPEKKIRLTLTYPLSTGRNFNELLRIIDSLQLTNNKDTATPVDWYFGESVVLSTVNANLIDATNLETGSKTIKPKK